MPPPTTSKWSSGFRSGVFSLFWSIGVKVLGRVRLRVRVRVCFFYDLYYMYSYICFIIYAIFFFIVLFMLHCMRRYQCDCHHLHNWPLWQVQPRDCRWSLPPLWNCLRFHPLRVFGIFDFSDQTTLVQSSAEEERKFMPNVLIWWLFP